MADDAAGLAPGKEDNTAARKKDRKDIADLVSVSYQSRWKVVSRLIRARLLFAAALAGALAFALVYNNENIGFLALYALLILLVTALAEIIFSPKTLRIEGELSKDTVFKNEGTTYFLYMKNRSVFFYPRVLVSFYHADVLKYEGKAIPTSLRVLEGVRREFHVTFPYRGVYSLGLKELVVTDFLSLFKRKIPVRGSPRVVVFPQLDEDFIATMRMELRNTVFSFDLFNEDYSSVADVRKYDQSDDIRKIHWKLSAKRSELLVKNFQNLEPNKTMVILDTSPIPLENPWKLSFEDQMVSRAASAMQYFMWGNMKAGFLYGGTLGEQISLDPEEGMDKALRVLAEVSFDSPVSRVPACCTALQEDVEDSNLCLFLSSMDARVHDALREYISMGNEVLLYFCHSPAMPLTSVVNQWLESLRAFGVHIHLIELRW